MDGWFVSETVSLTGVNEAVEMGNECGMRDEKRKPTDAFLVGRRRILPP